MQLSSHGVAPVADGIARLALLALCLLLPAFFLPVSWAALPQSKMLIVAVFAIVAVLGWWVARTTEGELHLPRTVLIWALGLLPLAYIFSTVAAGFHGASLVGQGIEQDTLTAVIVWFALSAVTAFVFAGRHEISEMAAKALAVGFSALFVFQVLYTLMPTVFSLGGLLDGKTANIIGSWHDLGILAGLGMFMSFALWRMRAFQGMWRVLLVTLGVSSFLVLILTHFSDLFWGTFALFLLGFVIHARTVLRVDGSSLIGAVKSAAPWAVMAIVFFGLSLYGPRIVDVLPSRMQITQVEVRPSWQGTFDVARQTLAAPTSVIFGSGPNSFTRAWGQYKPEGVNLTPFWDSDFNFGVGIIPTSIMSAGIFGLIAWGAVVLVLLGLMFRFVREARHLSDARTALGVFLAGTAYLLAFHFIYTPGNAITGLTFISLGLVAATSVIDSPVRTIRIGARNAREIIVLLFLLLVAVLVLISAGLIAREIVSNLYVNRAAIAYQRDGSIASAIAHVQTALTISSKNDRAHRAAAELGLVELARLAQNAEQNNAEVAAQLQATLQSTIQHGLTAVSINDDSYQNWLSLAAVYGNLAGVQVQGALDSAIEAYTKAAEANPTNPTPPMRLAQLALAKNDAEGAKTHLMRAITLKPDLALAHYMRSQIEATQGNGDAAVAAAAEAVRLVPQEPIAWFNLGYILFLGGVFQDAGVAFEQAIALRPEYANALYMLGLTYYQLQLTDNADAAMTRVMELNPSETWIVTVIDNMRAGKPALEGVAQTQ